MKKLLRSMFVSALLLGSFAAPVLAAGLGDAGGTLGEAGRPAGYNTANTNVPQLVGSIVNIFLGIVGVLCVVLIIYGGYQWMIARGDEKMVTKAKDTLRNATIGLIIIMSAYVISGFVLRSLIQATGAGGTPAAPTTP